MNHLRLNPARWSDRLIAVLALIVLCQLTGFSQAAMMFSSNSSGADVKAAKERQQKTKMSANLLSTMDAYDKMVPGESLQDIMPNVDEFLIMQEGKVGLRISCDDVDQTMEELRSKGISEITHHKQGISCMVPMDRLHDFEGLRGAHSIALSMKPHRNIGAATSQGDIAQKSDITRLTYMVDGTGSKIGVLSDSYDALGGAATDIITGDLPGPGNPNGYTLPVDVLSDIPGASDEGRAMMQIIHDVAPGAELAFHTAFISDLDFAIGILDLFVAGCNIIVDDIYYFNEPFYSPSIVAQFVDFVCGAGAMYFSSAGNSDRESYEGIYDGTALPAVELGPGYVDAHSFAAGDDKIALQVGPGSYIFDFQWDQPFFSHTFGASASTDLDVAVYVDGVFLGASIADNIFVTGDASEIFGITAFSDVTIELHIARWNGPPANRIKVIVFANGVIKDWEYGGDAPTLVGHANTAGACAVGASAWFFTPKFGVDPPGLNSFSSWGGVPIVFDAAGNPIAPIVYNKPEFVAPDGGNNTFFGSDTGRDPDVLPNFFGTSAAAPHAAAAASLLIETGETKASTKTLLINTAQDMLTPGFDFGSGAGLIRVPRAMSMALGENASPNCRDLNISVQPDGFARINLAELIVNTATGVGDLEVLVETSWGGRVYYYNGHVATDLITITDACALAGQTLKVTISNSLGTCWSAVTLKNASNPFIPSRNVTVYCDDPLVKSGGIGGMPPTPLFACEDVSPATHVADWVTPYPCEPGIQDTVKVIVREWEAFDKRGRRGVGFDTIVVLQFPEIDLRHIYCGEKDTVYCADTLRQIGPFITYDSLNTGICDTTYLIHIEDADNDGMLEFVANEFEAKCGINVHVDYWKFGGDCDINYKVVVELKQTCFGPAQQTCTVSPPAGTMPNNAQLLGPGYWRCEFWVTDLDTLAPIAYCKGIGDPDFGIVYTNEHECAAHTYLPELYVEDDWSGIKQVKATIEGLGSFVLTPSDEENCYSSHTLVKLPKNEDGYKIVYEVYDSCHNITEVHCFLTVKDRTRPVAVVDKGVTVSLSDKKVWVDATTFDEGSWDNCAVNLFMVRRADWYEACIDLCDSIDTCFVTEHHDTIWNAVLEDDKHLDATEAHYRKTLDWLWNDDQACNELVYNSWQFDLMWHASTYCKDTYWDKPGFKKELLHQLLNPNDENYPLISKFKCDNGVGPFSSGDILFVATGNNPVNEDAADSDNRLFAIDIQTGEASEVLGEEYGVEAMTADPANNRIYFAQEVELANSNGTTDKASYLWMLPLETGKPVRLGFVTHNGHKAEIEGLAMAGDKLLAFFEDFAFVPDLDGIYEIDLSNLTSTLIFNTEVLGYSEWSLAYDDVTEKLYGVDASDPDSIFEIDYENQQVIYLGVNVPDAANIDPDGLAAGNGRLYIIDDDGIQDSIFVYDLVDKVFVESIANPFINSDSESGAAALFARGICGLEASALKAKIDAWSQIGGGWSDQVVFSCEDACGPVTVEILVMDYWCNWTKAWTNVWVEDKTPVNVAKDVVEEETISCKSYKDKRYTYPNELHPVSLDYVVEQAKLGEQDAYDLLDAVFGGYCKAWMDPYGNYVDNEGVEIDCDITFQDSICDCTSYVKQVRVYDEHLGYLWKDSLVTECFYEEDEIDFQKGIVVVNCEENVHCEQEVWCEFDHCGQGYIFRKFKIWQGCPDSFYLDHNVPDSLKHPVDTIYRHQRIWVQNACVLNKYMFDVPYDTTVYSCNIDYDGAGNVIGDAGPENTGMATYKFDDDCRIVGIGHSDKVFKVVGGDAACYKIIRTWYFADWCGTGGTPVNGNWWYDHELVLDSCVQKIIVIDTMPPVCTITGPVEDGGAIEVGACAFDLSVQVDAEDACGLTRFYWELKNISDPEAAVVVDDGDGDLTEDMASFEIESTDLPHGTYKLKVVTVDECNNEGYCEYTFDVVSVKKPSPVCVTSLTARLTPWDSDGDGVADTAKAVVWAGEFDSSSEPACQDTAIEFRIELITGDSTDLSAAGDVDSLALGCNDAGSHIVRLWVISLPSDTRDYCDVVLIVQSDDTGCEGTNVAESEPIREVGGMQGSVKKMDRSMLERNEVNIVGPAGRPSNSNQLINGYALDQNIPNPFRAETNIGFVLPNAMEATITVYDVTGRIMRTVEGDFVKGYNQVQFRQNDLGVSGILYYRLNAGEFTATRKMILID